MTRRQRTPLANDSLAPVLIAFLRCGGCQVQIARRFGSIYAVVGTDVRAWCSPICAAACCVRPWAGADLECRATWQ